MINILFWNLSKKDLENHIRKLCDELDINILILAENQIPVNTLLNKLNKDRSTNFLIPEPIIDTNINYLSTLPHSLVTSVKDEINRISVKTFNTILEDFTIIAVHLRSKYMNSDDDQYQLATRIQSTINEIETQVGHDRTIIIGDFNMNPFEKGLVSSESFHAIMDKNIAMKGSRKVHFEYKKFFYNPMWGLLGDTSNGPPGTYYKNIANPINYYWHTFDQVLLRPSMLKYFNSGDLKIITMIGKTSLIKKNGLTKGFSDHLPIFLSLNL